MAINSYQQADEQCVRRGRPSAQRKLTHNTYLERRDEGIAVRLHATDIVTFHTDDTVVLDTGGWFTVTTKARMNDYIPRGWRLWSDRGTWWLATGAGRFRYVDGIRVSVTSGLPIGTDGELEAALNAVDDHNHRVRKDITKYVKDFTLPFTQEQMYADGFNLQEHIGGDCWHCLMVTEDGKTMGEVSGGDHLTSHMEERYYVTTLALRALQVKGYRMPALILFDQRDTGKLGNSARRALRDYMSKQLLVGVAAGGTQGGRVEHGDALKWYRDHRTAA